MPRLVGLCLLGGILAAAAPVARAQEPPSPDLDRLRAEARAHPDSFPVVFALGQALTRAANERTGDWRPRAEARRVLDAAYRLRPEDPRVLAELGFLLRKQGFRPDAVRMLKRAEERVEKSGATLSPRERAELHFQLALIYEVWWEDGENLGILPADFVTGSCPHIANYYPPGMIVPSSALSNLLMYNVVCPDVYDELMDYWYRPEGQNESDFVTMVTHFRAATAADPTDVRPALRLLRHLAAGRMWEEYLAAAERLARAQPTHPDALLFLGLGYHQTGNRERADSAFSLAIEYADSALRRDMLEPEQLLRSQDSTSFMQLAPERQAVLTDAFWRARDPLFLSAENERLAEHLARLAYVEVAYSQPQSEIRGRWTARGAAWLRWGRPLQIRSIGGGDATALEFWDYGRGSPDLVFVRMKTYRWARYEELTAEYMRWARERIPELYAPEHPRVIAQLPFQAAAFRDSSGGAVLEVYAAVPGAALRRMSDVADMEAGVFVVTGDYWEPRAALRRRLHNDGEATALDATFPLPPGPYVLSLEALSGDVAAKQRERIDVPAFGDSLALSDLLLVDRFGADTSLVEDRAALAPVVSYTRAFPAGAPIGVVWEVYGLTTDPDGVARYTVRAEVADETQKNALVRFVRGLFGGESRPNGLEWNASRVPRSDGALVEFVTFDLPDAAPGPHRVFITVIDQLTGRSFTAHRAITVTQP